MIRITDLKTTTIMMSSLRVCWWPLRLSCMREGGKRKRKGKRETNQVNCEFRNDGYLGGDSERYFLRGECERDRLRG